MRADKLYAARRSEWNKLSMLVDRSQKGVQRLTPEEIDALGRMYRSATSDLALAQRDFPDHRVTAYLNQLVARAHATIYHDKPLATNRLVRFVTTGFPRLFRETLPFIIVATLFFCIPAILAGLSIGLNPDTARWLLPPSAQAVIPDVENQELWLDIPIEERPYTSTFIMQNNIQVSFLAFGGGIFAGLLTIWVMIFNGLSFGGLLGLTFHYGVGSGLLNFVIGHGVIELSVIMIAGGSGLMLGWAMLHPGMLRRRDALSLAARKAVRLLIGSVPLLLIAGAIEGFISPNEAIPWPFKWAVGLGSGVLLYSYLLFGGRSRARHSKVRPFSSK